MPLIKLNATQGLTGTLPAVSGANLTNVSAGKIGQVTQELFPASFQQTLNSSSPATLNDGSNDVDISITPTATSSKVLVMFNLGRVTGANSSSGYGTLFKIQRNGSDISTAIGTGFSSEEKGTFFHGTEALSYSNGVTFSFIDSPNTTSACNYSLLVTAHSTGDVVVSFNRYYTSVGNGGYRGSTLISLQAMEILA